MNYLAIPARKRQTRGISRKAALLTCAVLAAAALAVIPGVLSYQARRARFLCDVALERARETKIVDYLESGEIPDTENPILPGESLCPSGGECYLLPEGDGYLIVCGLHDSDIPRRARLNAVTALKRLQRALDRALLVWGEEPDTLSFPLNGREKAARRGEAPESGVENGIFYLCAEGKITRFCYLERYRRAVWTLEKGWGG